MKKFNFELEKKGFRRNFETNTMKEAVSDLLKFYKLKSKFNEMDAMDAWRKVMGESVARRTIKLQIIDRKMFIKLESASLKNELMMAKSMIIDQLNQAVGENTLDDLVFN